MQQNNGMKFSCDRKNDIDFKWAFWEEEGGSILKNVSWMVCVKESIFVWPLIRNDVSSFEMSHSPRDDVKLNPKSVHCSQQSMKYFCTWICIK